MPVSFAPMPCLMPTYTYYTVVAVKFGRGSLIQTGMNLDEEREYKILLVIITRLCLIGFETLAKS
jgi:hypothetical protein